MPQAEEVLDQFLAKMQPEAAAVLKVDTKLTEAEKHIVGTSREPSSALSFGGLGATQRCLSHLRLWPMLEAPGSPTSPGLLCVPSNPHP